MSGLGFNPQVDQGSLNRVATHVALTDFPALSVTAPYMGKSQAVLTFDDDFVDQEGTATGIVQSPKPYSMGTIVISLLRTQNLANAWINQVQQSGLLGTVTAFSDAPDTWQPISLTNCAIQKIDPGAYDGSDPVVKVTVRGTFYVNNNLWLGVTNA